SAARQLPQPAARMLRHLALLGLDPRAYGGRQPGPGGKNQNARRVFSSGASERGVPPPPRRQNPGTRGHHTQRLIDAYGVERWLGLSLTSMPLRGHASRSTLFKVGTART